MGRKVRGFASSDDNEMTSAIVDCGGSLDVPALVGGTKVLVVGAGGIGCELVKNLVLAGFNDIHLIDLDTIDVSNLNRQFLFRRKHVGQPKSIVARDAVLKFAGTGKVEIQAYQGNIKDEQFDAAFFCTPHALLRSARTH